MDLSAPQFAFNCLNIKPILPSAKESSNGKVCWLCGGEIKDNGWSLKHGISKTFTNHNQARELTSDTVCYQCVTFFRVESWKNHVESLPETTLKTSKVTAWQFYSHIFSKSGHLCPSRAQWKDYLLNPPDPPFIFTVAVSGKKHLIFRSNISYSREMFNVKFEEEDFFIERKKFRYVLAKFEEFYNLGFSKKSILTGDYNLSQIIKVGIKTWKAFDDIFKNWRKTEIDILKLVEFCAQKKEEKKNK